MRVIKSSMELLNFSILNTKYLFISYEDVNIHIENEKENWVCDIDFDIKEANDKVFVIIVNVIINKEQNPGYYIDVNAVMYVKFDDNISADDKQNLILYSGLSMCIANVRAYISNITSYYPLGKYTFPSIDLNALILSKKEQV